MPDKKRERWYFDRLRECLDEIPAGEPEPTELPDFLVGSGARRLGVEVTEYYHPPPVGERPQQELQALRDRVIDLAERLHASAGGPALYLTAIFGDHGELTKKTVRPIANALARAVLAKPVPNSIHELTVELDWDERPREIGHVHIHGSVDGVDKLWYASSAGWVDRITVADVQREIERKERGLDVCRQRCVAVWLVIAHSLTRGAPAELSEDATSSEYTSRFDRVLWLEAHGPRVIALGIRAPAEQDLSRLNDQRATRRMP